MEYYITLYLFYYTDITKEHHTIYISPRSKVGIEHKRVSVVLGQQTQFLVLSHSFFKEVGLALQGHRFHEIEGVLRLVHLYTLMHAQ